MNVLLVSVTAAVAQANGPTAAAAAAVGAQQASFQEFLGIRYATSSRFTPSELADFDGPLEHGKYGRICPQPLLPQYVPFKDEIVSEDCHFINVHTPAGAAAAAVDLTPRREPKKALLPVMVWIHGGGFTGGAGSFYNGSVMAANNGVVVVTLNCESLHRPSWLAALHLRSCGPYGCTVAPPQIWPGGIISRP